MEKPVIALLTDFGLQDTYVGVMKGVIAVIAPQTKVIDLTHAIEPQDVQAAAFALLTSHEDFPNETIFCCVVDPEAGGDRAAMAVRLEPYAFVFPGNGLLTPILQEWRWKPWARASTPHGCEGSSGPSRKRLPTASGRRSSTSTASATS